MEEKKKTPEIYPYKKFTFDKGAKAIQQTKRISFLKTNGVGITRHPFEKRKKKKPTKPEPGQKVQEQLTLLTKYGSWI